MQGESSPSEVRLVAEEAIALVETEDRLLEQGLAGDRRQALDPGGEQGRQVDHQDAAVDLAAGRAGHGALGGAGGPLQIEDGPIPAAANPFASSRASPPSVSAVATIWSPGSACSSRATSCTRGSGRSEPSR